MKEKEEIEEWRDVPGYEGKYQVSNFGRVKSLARFVLNGNKHWQPERIFKKYLNNRGYEELKLYKGNREFKNVQLHRLVAQAFIPNPNNYPQINHIDGNPENSRVENLEWCTNSMNTKHAYDTGLKDPKNYKGSANCNAKLTDEQVINIRLDRKNGMSISEVSIKYGIRKNHVGLISNGHIWKHLLNKQEA